MSFLQWQALFTLFFLQIVTAQASVKDTSSSCLPLFDQRRDKFERCLRYVCVLFTDSPPSVELGTGPHHILEVPFICRFRRYNYEGLNGLFFDAIDLIPELDSSLCIYARGCSSDQLINFLNYTGQHGKYRFIVGGFPFLMPQRISNYAIPSVSFFNGHLAVYKKQPTLLESIGEGPFRFKQAILIFLVGIAVILLALTLQVLQGRRYRVWVSCILFFCVVFTSFGTGYFILGIYHVIQAQDSWLFSPKRKLREPIEDFKYQNVEKFVVEANSAEEKFIEIHFGIRSRRMQVGRSHWKSANNLSHVFSRIQDGKSGEFYGYVYNIFAEHLLKKRSSCDRFVECQALGRSREVSSVWYFSSSIPLEQRVNINRQISALRHESSVFPTLSVEFCTRENHIGTAFGLVAMLIAFQSFIAFTAFKFIHWNLYLYRWVLYTLALSCIFILAHVEISSFGILIFSPIIAAMSSLLTSVLIQCIIARREANVRDRNSDSVDVHSATDTVVSRRTGVEFGNHSSRFEITFKAFYTIVNQKIDEKCAVSRTHDEINKLEAMTLSEHLNNQLLTQVPFLECIGTEIETLRNALENNLISSFCYQNGQIVVQSKSSASFIVIIDDFLLIYDFDHARFGVRVPSSVFKWLSYASLLQDSGAVFDALIGTEMSIQQVYFMARRFVQFTGASWNYDCLALLEQKLPEAAALRADSLKRFDEIVIDLQPTSFECLFGCSVGYVKVNEKEFHNVAISVFGTVIGFRRTESGIACPVVREDLELVELHEHTDGYNMAIGGSDHETAIDMEPFTCSVLPEYKGVDIAPLPKTNQAKLFDIIPSVLELESTEDENVYHLAYVPNFEQLSRIQGSRYKLRELRKMKADFCEIGYGLQLANAIVDCVKRTCSWNNYPSGISLSKAQDLLLSELEFIRKRTLVPIKLVHSNNKYVLEGEHFLLLNGNKLYIVRNTKKVNRSMMAGISGSIGILSLFKISPSVSIQTTVSIDDIAVKGEVSSLQDAVEKISGLDLRRLGFKPFKTGCGGLIPTPLGMEQVLGAGLFICKLLQGRVNPSGRFKNALHPAAEESRDLSNEQQVNFDMPLSAGIVCSTFVRDLSWEEHQLPILAHRAWNKYKVNTYPVIMGIDQNDTELDRLMIAKR